MRNDPLNYQCCFRRSGRNGADQINFGTVAMPLSITVVQLIASTRGYFEAANRDAFAIGREDGE
jgi:hypothetical protein